MWNIEAIIESEWLNGVLEVIAEVRLGAFHASEISTFDPARHPNSSYRGAGYFVGHPTSGVARQHRPPTGHFQ